MENIIGQLKALNNKLDVIIGIMKKPENKAGKVLETAGAVVAVMGVLSIIDILRNWLGF